MDKPGSLTPIQIEVARAFFQLPQSEGYVLAGGAALLANGLISRPTEDIDLFPPPPPAGSRRLRPPCRRNCRAAVSP